MIDFFYNTGEGDLAAQVDDDAQLIPPSEDHDNNSDPGPLRSSRVESGLTIKDILEILTESDHLGSAKEALQILDRKTQERLQIEKGFSTLEFRLRLSRQSVRPNTPELSADSKSAPIVV